MKDRTLAKKVGAVIRRLRNDAGLSQEDFADLVGVHRTYIGAIERAEKTVTLDTLQKIAVALKVKMWELIRLIED
jgi:transcriptional regulator with XRE-family HTH domain